MGTLLHMGLGTEMETQIGYASLEHATYISNETRNSYCMEDDNFKEILLELFQGINFEKSFMFNSIVP